jgi:hypothetical protein
MYITPSELDPGIPEIVKVEEVVKIEEVEEFGMVEVE